jgi:hypothetical protein
MISFAWFSSFLWIFPITGWATIFKKGERDVPPNQCNTEFNDIIIFKITTGIVNFYIPLIAMISINTKIYLVIKKRYRNPIMRNYYGPTKFTSSRANTKNIDKSQNQSSQRQSHNTHDKIEYDEINKSQNLNRNLYTQKTIGSEE